MSLFIILLNVEQGVVYTESDEAGQHIVTAKNVEFFV